MQRFVLTALLDVYKRQYKCYTGFRAGQTDFLFRKHIYAFYGVPKRLNVIPSRMTATCQSAAVPVESVPTMAELGKACGIEVGAAVAALLRD